jgi:hypothetical protein
MRSLKEVISDLYGNGKKGYFTRIEETEDDIKQVFRKLDKLGVYFYIIMTGIIANASMMAKLIFWG